MGKTTWTALAGLLAASLAVTGFASAQLGDDLSDRDVQDLLDEQSVDGECLGADLFAGDFELSARTVIEREQQVDLDRDDVFLAIALGNNGGDADFADVRNVEARERVETERTRTSDLDEDTVFSLLALGEDTGVDPDCLGDVTERVERTTVVGRETDLDEEDVFLGLAFGSVGFGDLADIDQVFERSLDVDRTFDLDEDDALLSLAFG